MNKILLCLITFIVINVNAQENALFINIIPHVEEMEFEFETVLTDLNGKKFDVSYFNYYLSNLHVIHDGGQDLDLSDSVFLIKKEDHLLNLGFQNVQSVEAINFSIGVPESVNHLDLATYPLDHPLSSQVPSMHWGWSAGYAFMIIGGRGDNTGDNVPNNLFEIHCLGDANFKNVSVPTIGTQTSSNQIDVTLYCNVDQWMSGVDLGTVGSVHSLNGVVTDVMNNVNDREVFVSPANASVENLTETEGNLFAVNHTNVIEIKWSEMLHASSYQLIDMNGRVLNTSTIKDKNGSLTFSDLSKGSYQFVMYNQQGQQLNSTRFIY
jgi:hypothetical protein